MKKVWLLFAIAQCAAAVAQQQQPQRGTWASAANSIAARGGITYASQHLGGSSDCGIDEAYSSGPSTGAYVVMDVGGCTISSPQTIRMVDNKPLHLELAGSALNFSHTSGCGLTIDGSAVTKHRTPFSIANGLLAYTGAGGTLKGLCYHDVVDGVAYNLSLHNFCPSTAWALYLDSGSQEDQWYGIRLNNQYAPCKSYAAGNGIWLDGANTQLFDGLNMQEGVQALRMDNGGEAKFISTTIQGWAAKGAIVLDASGGPIGSSFDGLHMEGNGDGSSTAAAFAINLASSYLIGFSIRDSGVNISSGHVYSFAAGAGGYVQQLTSANNVYNIGSPALGICAGPPGVCLPGQNISSTNDTFSGNPGFGTAISNGFGQGFFGTSFNSRAVNSGRSGIFNTANNEKALCSKSRTGATDVCDWTDASDVRHVGGPAGAYTNGPLRIGSGMLSEPSVTIAGPTSAISPSTCTKEAHTAVSGVTATAALAWAITGASPASVNYGGLTPYFRPDASGINLSVCNNTSRSITPSPVKFSVRTID